MTYLEVYINKDARLPSSSSLIKIKALKGPFFWVLSCCIFGAKGSAVETWDQTFDT